MTSRVEPHETCAAGDRTVVQPDKQALLNRLSRIGGQVKGIAGMIETDRYCVDILTQVSAAQSALDAVALQLLDSHMRGCVQRAIRNGDGDAAINELMQALQKISR